MTTVTITEQVIEVTVSGSTLVTASTPGVTVAATEQIVTVTPSITSVVVAATHPQVTVTPTVSTIEVSVAPGVTDHGALTGLADDDHPQYHTDARGDLRYWPRTTDLATQTELNSEASTRTSADSAESATRVAADALLVPQTRTLTINGTALDLSADRAWTVGAITVGTKAAIQATTPTAGTLGFSTDTLEFWIYSGAWYKVVMPLVVDSPNPDMGYVDTSPRTGYSATVITDKVLNNVRVLSNALTAQGAIRSVIASASLLEVFQVYLNGGWRDIVQGVTMRELFANYYALEHNPAGNVLNDYINVFSGNGNLLGLNGRPVIQQYRISMGAYPSLYQTVIDGGTF